jgi:glycosyltransferase involved in cell wall biosynthesis
MKVAIVTPAVQDPERLFGAERHFLGMVNAFEQKVDTTWIPVPLSEATWEDVLQSYIRCYELDVSAYDLVISTKNPTFMVRHPNHVCWLLHQIRVFYDRFDDEYGKLDTAQLTEKRRQQETIQLLDNLAFQGVRKIFTNGHETARRLKQYNGFDAEVLYPPVLSEGHYCSGQDYFLLPGRLHRWKRVDLVLRAMQHLKPDVPLLIPGTGEDEPYFRELAKNDPRIAFLGFVTDQELLDLYANALAVLFVPKEEDFGYITIEAMLSHKPVIVCTDSGEPARLVQNGSSGFVVKPDAVEIAAAMSVLAKDRKLARDMGEYACAHVPSQSWSAVVEKLLQPTNVSSIAHQFADIAPRRTHHPDVQVLVTDNQVLEPAIGGARVRVMEVCKGLASRFSTEYIGAFDWKGPSSTDDTPPGWRCRVFALSKLHYWLSNRLQRWVKGGSVIDVSFSILAHTSRTFLRTLRESVKQADVVVFCHPWCYPLAKSLLGGKYIIYDAHNFEWGLRRELLSATGVGRILARHVRCVEGELARRSTEVWACSAEDADQISVVYNVPRKHVRVVPNCADTRTLAPASDGIRKQAKETFGWGERPVAIFIASGYGPNTEATAFIVETMAVQLSEIVFAIIGTVRDDYARALSEKGGSLANLPANVYLPGVVDESTLYAALHASDVGLNPILGGSGTNLKLIQFMAAGLPVVSTRAGVRGVPNAGKFCCVADREVFPEVLVSLLKDEGLRLEMGHAARTEAETNYDWTAVTHRVAQLIERNLKYQKRLDPPFFSVVIPTYNRPDNLLRLLGGLAQQVFPDFEVVVVDQSDAPVEISDDLRQRLRIRYLYSQERGMAVSRNKGRKEASGTVVAFTDDDCLPERDWLEKAAGYFDANPIAGLEGRVRSTHLGDPRYRTVSNVNFEGVGFMTANMFYRRDVLETIGGFDERFRVFREDTDLGWRALQCGDIPHARDVVVFHPPHPVDLKRESRSERVKMFCLDPLLFNKHPHRYIDLIYREGHYRQTTGYWSNFARGITEYGIEPPLHLLFNGLRIADPAWWSAVHDGTNKTSYPYDADDIAALNVLLQRVTQKA